MKKLIFTLLWVLVAHATKAQYFQFTQYQFTPQRVNPAWVADPYAKIDFNYRRQATATNMAIQSNALSLNYPVFHPKNKNVMAGIGVFGLDDRNTSAGVLINQEFGISSALSVQIADDQALALGFEGIYRFSRLTYLGFTTGSQYLDGIGFDPSAANGEQGSYWQSSAWSFGTGLRWQKLNKGMESAHVGLALIDFTNPNVSFFDQEARVPTTLVLSTQFLVWQYMQLQLFPQLLATRSAGVNQFTGGLKWRYLLANNDQSIDLNTQYTLTSDLAIGVQFNHTNFSAGIAYDVPIHQKNVSNRSAIEVGVEIRKLVAKRGRIKKRKKRKATKKVYKKPIKKQAVAKPKQTPESKPIQEQEVNQEPANTDNLIKEKRVPEKPKSIKIFFGFDSKLMHSDAKQHIANQLKKYDLKSVKLVVTGHTDTSGPAEYNKKLSLQRAQAVADHLIKLGVPKSQIIVEGKGESEPQYTGTDKNKQLENRRVMLTFIELPETRY